jgi:MFS family permease
MGTRQSQSLFLSSMNTTTGIGFAKLSLAFAIAQLTWGLTQPFAGAWADRFGSGRVLVTGAVLVGLGSALATIATTLPLMILAIGVLAAAGAGMAGPSVLMAAVNKRLPPERRAMATGIVNAGGSFGQFSIAPLAGFVLTAYNWITAMWVLAALMVLALPLAAVLRSPAAALAAPASGERGLKETIRKALTDPSYVCLALGFFVCGFHVAFIAVHMPGVIALCQLPATVSAWSLAVIGLFNIAGSFTVGWAMGRWRMKSLLSLIYASRALAVLIFLVSPKNEATILLFSAVLGFTYLSTVPPTAGLIAKMYGPRWMATLFGIVMLSHQIGGFLGAYLGGKVFESTGSYTWMWYADIMLAIGAALIHLPIKEAPLTHPQAA